MIFPKRPSPRKFDYEPRYYDPTEDERFKRRLRFTSSTRRGRNPALIWLLIIFILVVLIYLFIPAEAGLAG